MSRSRNRLPLLLVVLALALPGVASAHDIELTFENAISPDPDDSAAPLLVERMAFGVARSVGRDLSGAINEVSGPSFTSVTLTRVLDYAAPELFGQGTSGASLGNATISVYEPDPSDPGQRRLVEEYTLRSAVVLSWSVEATAGFGLLEELNLYFTGITWCPFSYDESGVQTAGECEVWDPFDI